MAFALCTKAARAVSDAHLLCGPFSVLYFSLPFLGLSLAHTASGVMVYLGLLPFFLSLFL